MGAAVHLLCRRKPLGTQHGPGAPDRSSSWWTDAGPGWVGGQAGVQSADDRSRPREVVLQDGGHEDGWGSAGGPSHQQSSPDCEAVSPQVQVWSLLLPPSAACAPSRALGHQSQAGLPEASGSRQVLQRLIQMTQGLQVPREEKAQSLSKFRPRKGTGLGWWWRGP